MYYYIRQPSCIHYMYVTLVDNTCDYQTIRQTFILVVFQW